ncbi:MAG: class I SAM-dependent methyltransferase [Pseudomonadota bacterium]|nr:class I SAM-dependent methyltransferase [Pseudomonadota bacterium]
MNNDCYKREACRLCGGTSLVLVIALTPSPPANAFVPPEEVGHMQKVYPLDVYFCKSCGHVQLLDVVDPDQLFSKYVYVSGTSPVFVKHFNAYAKDVIERYKLKPESLVVDIGSNDGTFLRNFYEAGFRTIGVDPAEKIAGAASMEGIETIVAFFNKKISEKIKVKYGKASIITANNVFAHADNLVEFLEGASYLLDDKGVFLFEVSYFLDVLEKTLFDSIYHEHLAYHTLKPLVRFLYENGFEMINVQRTNAHGGSLRCAAQLVGGSWIVERTVEDLIIEEEQKAIHSLKTLSSFEKKISVIKKQVSNLLRELKQQGKVVAGFGAPAKSTTLMYHFGIGVDTVHFIVDDSPLKQGLYSPGLHIPIVGSDELRIRKPDYLIIFAWNFADSIIANNSAYSAGGGKFIVPLPKLRVI